MKIPPDCWKDMDGFIKFRGFANKLPVTNNSAERNVKLVQDLIDAYHTESMKQDTNNSAERNVKLLQDLIDAYNTEYEARHQQLCRKEC